MTYKIVARFHAPSDADLNGFWTTGCGTSTTSQDRRLTSALGGRAVMQQTSPHDRVWPIHCGQKRQATVPGSLAFQVMAADSEIRNNGMSRRHSQCPCKRAPSALAMTVKPIGPSPNHKGEAAGIDVDFVAVDRSRVINRVDRD
jgi:hypothetical protein